MYAQKYVLRIVA